MARLIVIGRMLEGSWPSMGCRAALVISICIDFCSRRIYVKTGVNCNFIRSIEWVGLDLISILTKVSICPLISRTTFTSASWTRPIQLKSLFPPTEPACLTVWDLFSGSSMTPGPLSLGHPWIITTIGRRLCFGPRKCSRILCLF